MDGSGARIVRVWGPHFVLGDLPRVHSSTFVCQEYLGFTMPISLRYVLEQRSFLGLLMPADLNPSVESLVVVFTCLDVGPLAKTHTDEST